MGNRQALSREFCRPAFARRPTIALSTECSGVPPSPSPWG